jgi:hypothetical protein
MSCNVNHGAIRRTTELPSPHFHIGVQRWLVPFYSAISLELLLKSCNWLCRIVRVVYLLRAGKRRMTCMNPLGLSEVFHSQ